MKVDNKDISELRGAISSIKVNMFKGCANVCPECKREGHFGSIIKYQCESDNWYLLCGWCGNISSVKEKIEKVKI